MTYIWFNVKQAYDHLFLKGYVYTLRTYSKFPQICMARTSLFGSTIDIGKVKVEKADTINEATKHKLEAYVRFSGFENASDWYSAATMVHKDTDFILYRVEMIK